MNKKVMSVILIVFIAIYSVIGVNVHRSYAIAPAIPLVAKYLLGSAIVAGGVVAADNESLDTAIYETYEKMSITSKENLQRTAIAASAAGYLTYKFSDDVWKNIMQSISEVFSPGETVIETSDFIVPTSSTWDYCVSSITTNKGNVLTVSYTQDSPFQTGGYPAVVIYLNGNLYNGFTIMDKNIVVTGAWLSLKQSYVTIWYTDSAVSGIHKHETYKSELFCGSSMLGKVVGANQSMIYEFNNRLTVSDVNFDWFNSKTMDNSRAVPLPPHDLTDEQMQDLIDGLLGKTAEEVQEQDLDLEWWLDENGNIIKVKKGEEPPGGKDGKILISPIPLPDKERLPGEPEVQVIDEPPIVTEETLPDGTIKRTTVVPKTTVTTTYDPKTGTKTSTTVITKTITIQIIDPSTGTEISREDETNTEPGPTIEETIPKSTIINWEPIRRPAGELTWKFPFSLPWDLKRSFQQLVTSEKWNPVIPINFDAPLMGNVAFNIDLTMFDGLIKVVRVIELLLFDVGLILLTRKLMGGDV